MLMLVNESTVRLFVWRTESSEYGATRRYYCAVAPYRCILVTREGLDLAGLRGQVVDATIGWERGGREFVRPGNEGLAHTKITVFRVVRGAQADATTLAHVLRRAPKDGEG